MDGWGSSLSVSLSLFCFQSVCKVWLENQELGGEFCECVCKRRGIIKRLARNREKKRSRCCFFDDEEERMKKMKRQLRKK